MVQGSFDLQHGTRIGARNWKKESNAESAVFLAVYLIIKPFLGKKKGATNAEVLSRAVEHWAMKEAAAEMTQRSDDTLEHILRESQAERLRIQREAEAARELPLASVR